MSRNNVQYTIEEVHGVWWLCQRGEYERTSVLAGQDYRQLFKPYNSLEEAQLDNPGVEVSDEGAPHIYIPDTQPDWFDEADAGEKWSEDEY